MKRIICSIAVLGLMLAFTGGTAAAKSGAMPVHSQAKYVSTQNI